MYNTSTSNMTATGAQEVNDVPRISRLTGGLQQVIAAHAEIAALMEQRLHGVLAPMGANLTGSGVEGNAPKPVMSPLASDLETFELQLHELGNRYNDILNRLEI